MKDGQLSSLLQSLKTTLKLFIIFYVLKIMKLMSRSGPMW